MKLMPTENYLKGRWLLKDGRVVADEVCVRIDELTQGHLRKLGRDGSGWDILFADPDDGRLWELIYLESELYGGGAPELRHLENAQAKAKYGDSLTGFA